MAGPADVEAEPGLGHGADAGAAAQLEAGRVAQLDARGEVGAVGDVGVVAGVLDHHGDRARRRRARSARRGKRRPLLGARQRDLDLGRRVAVAQQQARRLGRRGRAGARRPAAAQLAVGHAPRAGRQVGLAQLRRLHGRPSSASVAVRATERAVAVAVAGVVDVRAPGGRVAVERRADDHERLRRDLRAADRLRQLAERAAQHDLVGPRRAVDDRARRRRARSRPRCSSACSSRGRRTERNSAIVVPCAGERGQLLVGRHRASASRGG